MQNKRNSSINSKNAQKQFPKQETMKSKPNASHPQQTQTAHNKLEIMETKPSFSIPEMEVIETNPNCSSANQTLQFPQVETIEYSDTPKPLLPDLNRQSKIFRCKECFAVFTNAKSLAGHMGSHAKKRIFQARLQEKLRVLKRAKPEREAPEMKRTIEEMANAREEVGENDETQIDHGSSEVLITSSYRVVEDGVIVIDEDDDDDI